MSRRFEFSLSVTLFLLSTIAAHLPGQTWEIKNPYPWSNSSSAIFFVDSLYGWVAGNGGNVLKTTDGGATWVAYGTSKPSYLHDITFINRDVGWVVGEVYGREGPLEGINSEILYIDVHSVLEKTLDGGKTWAEVGAPMIRDSSYPACVFRAYTYRSVQFTDESHGSIVANAKFVFRTTDGGNSWSIELVDSSSAGASARIKFATSQFGWATAYFGSILRTTDGGVSWVDIRRDVLAGVLPGISAICAKAGGDVWVTTRTTRVNPGQILHSSDRGSSWHVQLWDSTSKFTAITFFDSLRGFAIGDAGLYLQTENGGQDWSRRTIGVGGNLVSSSFVDENHGWLLEAVSADYHLYRTENGGADWSLGTSFAQPTGASGLRRITFVDTCKGWMIASTSAANSGILFTSDGGRTWIQQVHPFMMRMNEVFFLDSLRGWVVGDGWPQDHDRCGGILRTTNGGTSWEVMEGLRDEVFGYELSIQYSGVVFADSGEGWIAGEGMIFHSTDGGTTWQRQTPGGSFGNLHFCLAAKDALWAAGDISSILKYVPNAETGVDVPRWNGPAPATGFDLLQNYPNPFNGQTEIAFETDRAGVIAVEIYNLLGQSVGKAFEGWMDEGHHAIRYDAGRLPSGVYLYRLRTSVGTLQKRMILVR